MRKLSNEYEEFEEFENPEEKKHLSKEYNLDVGNGLADWDDWSFKELKKIIYEEFEE